MSTVFYRPGKSLRQNSDRRTIGAREAMCAREVHHTGFVLVLENLESLVICVQVMESHGI